MKCVCISCFDYYDTRMRNIINFFKSRNYETTYLVADFNHFNKKYDNHKHHECKTIHVPSYQRNLSAARLNSHRIFAKYTKKFLLQKRPDVIYCIFPPNLLVREVISYKNRFPTTRVAFDCYDLWPESFPYGDKKKFLKLPFFIWGKLRDKYITKADLILTLSEKVRLFLCGKTKNIPIKVLYPSIELTTVPNYLFCVEERISFCYLGNVNHITDTELMLCFLTNLSEKKRVCVHFIGSGQNYSEFTQKIINHKIEVIGHGPIFDMDEKNKIFSLCDFGINMPRKEISTSISLKAIEYMRAGLPIINSGLGDSEKMTREGRIGINVSKKNIDDIVDRIVELSRDDFVRMHENCMRFYFNKFLKQDYDTILQELI